MDNNHSSDDNGCLYAVIIAVFVGLIVWLASSHDSQHQAVKRSEPSAEPAYYYTPPASDTYASPSPSSVEQEEKAEEQPSPPATPYKPLEVKMPAAYEEGYDKGYDDGEDDALSGSGYGYQFDSSCRYRGKKRKDYIDGYEDGYEAGYDDNMGIE